MDSLLTAKRNNLTATTAPTVNDDASAGYSIGSYWYNTSSGRVYLLISNTAGAANWTSLNGASYKGSWNAATNTPTLADGTGTNQDNYLVSVGGTQNLGSGAIVFTAGDLVIYNGTIWQKIEGGVPYTPEDVANKSTDGTMAGNSTTLYPSQSAVVTYASSKVADAINDGTTTIAPSQNAVFDALALKAPLVSPELTGTPTAPTATAGDNSTKIATTAYVDSTSSARLASGYTPLLSGSGTYTQKWAFTITSGSATVGATYTNNGNTFTVYATVASATLVYMNGASAPTSSGTLTKSAGTGDATLTFSRANAPIQLDVIATGGGGGGCGSGTSFTGGSGGNGTSTTFGSSLITCGGGTGAAAVGGGGAGGTGSIAAPAYGIGLVGGWGSSSGSTGTFSTFGASGGSNALGGAGGNNTATGVGEAGVPNTGAGGGGGGIGVQAGAVNGFGGGAGYYVMATIPNPSATYAYTIGTGGAAGAAGTNGIVGAVGATGAVFVREIY